MSRMLVDIDDDVLAFAQQHAFLDFDVLEEQERSGLGPTQPTRPSVWRLLRRQTDGRRGPRQHTPGHSRTAYFRTPAPADVPSDVGRFFTAAPDSRPAVSVGVQFTVVFRSFDDAAL